mmetsp:Transcript_58980/g.117187  ORF Transcript_58980/g.117187 Transcript_58980/m.117187 type:complete len:80 (+) Transcript_58980:726-965(+)
MFHVCGIPEGATADASAWCTWIYRAIEFRISFHVVVHAECTESQVTRWVMDVMGGLQRSERHSSLHLSACTNNLQFGRY